MLGKLPKFYDDNLIVGIETSDDAAVYKINETTAMIQTLDFFTPIVDDPYMFGQIAAANALSDVYAMGGEPKVALNIVGFPNCLDPQILGEILRGGAEKVQEAGAVLVGGHSIQDDEPKYGLSVSGFVHPDKVWKNYGCNVGDILILTKQIGSGIINTAVKGGMVNETTIKEVENVMASLNKKAKDIAEQFHVTACTDVTGFGLLGHAFEMADASGVTLKLAVNSIPVFPEAKELAEMGFVPGGTYRNRAHTQDYVYAENVVESKMDILYDPQTSGGLLFSVAAEYENEIMNAFAKAEMDSQVQVIGTVEKQGPYHIVLHE